MNHDDAAIVLDAMSAMWPAHELTEAEIHLWTAHLGPIEYDDAMAVIGLLERSTRYWPHWSEFLDVHGPMQRRRAEATRAAYALGPGSARLCTHDENRAWIEHCRGILRDASGPLVRSLARGLS